MGRSWLRKRQKSATRPVPKGPLARSRKACSGKDCRPGRVTLPRVTCPTKSRLSGGNPKAPSSRSKCRANRLKASCPDEIPTHRTAGRLKFGKAPNPSRTNFMGGCWRATRSRASRSCGSRSWGTSPRNFKVRCRFSGRTHLTVQARKSPLIAASPSRTPGSSSTAMKRRNRVSNLRSPNQGLGTRPGSPRSPRRVFSCFGPWPCYPSGIIGQTGYFFFRRFPSSGIGEVATWGRETFTWRILSVIWFRDSQSIRG